MRKNKHIGDSLNNLKTYQQSIVILEDLLVGFDHGSGSILLMVIKMGLEMTFLNLFQLIWNNESEPKIFKIQ